jgi:L-alanine-DL-glutamate epimerase-like enolase superfamily enzyme
VRAVKLLEPHGIEFVEQPVRIDDLEAARFVRDRVDTPVALDESVRGPREALACVKAGACDIFVVKLMKTGGILNALKVNAIGEAAGIPVVMGNMGESSLGLAAHLQVSVALANVIHWDADLPHRPGGLARDIGSGLRGEVRDGVSTMLVPAGAGLGIHLNEEVVEAQRVTRRW